MAECKTVKALAAAIGVARRRIYKWQAEHRASSTPAPETLDLHDWHRWLLAVGKTEIARGMQLPLAAPPSVAQQLTLDAGDAPPEPAQPGEPGAVDPKIYWANRERKAKALAAERELAEKERQLLHQRDVLELVDALAAIVVEALSDVPILVRPALDGVDALRRRSIEDRLDHAVRETRDRLARSTRDRLRTLLRPAG